jgi:hypothetical protein
MKYGSAFSKRREGENIAYCTSSPTMKCGFYEYEVQVKLL